MPKVLKLKKLFINNKDFAIPFVDVVLTDGMEEFVLHDINGSSYCSSVDGNPGELCLHFPIGTQLQDEYKEKYAN